ncbi:polysaccharide deacetylase family protein [Paenibacillus sp. SYP-B3998]|uniref:Polysaccharide deacetylase family protein n=1 Tax=Paenibacillus sp. SYP-B3998 TaxID=2678564 RepID=A0A6G4A5L6_9BACL|nr:polysaccharide deacetylase family protein [Paenibacillus sp. SYP-B3998]NEW08937.1 polysaccharide deacetylase family protein [Paenibacillus sp. SYP-B3998]
MRHLAISLVAIGAVYTLVPWIITRILGIGVFRKGEETREIALTFDDGPNPLYTPQLLDMLKRHEVKATFFVLGVRAQQYPDLILRMHREGHQIGLHNYLHKSNWLMLPWTVRKEVERCAAQIQDITGEHPTCYRPPWGIFNVFDLLLRRDYTFVLWSLMAKDWRSRVGQKNLKSVLLHQITDGSVVLLHDCGETLGADKDAPLYMLRALEDVLHDLHSRDIRCVRIDEMTRTVSSENKHEKHLSIRS